MTFLRAGFLLCVFVLAGCSTPSVRPLATGSSVSEQRSPLTTAPDFPTHTWFKPKMSNVVQHGILTRNDRPEKNIYFAKVRINGEELDITSLSPRVLNEVTAVNFRAVSAIRFAEDYKELEFFTRHPISGEGFRVLIPLYKIEEGAAFDFPILTHNAGIEIKRIEVSDLAIKPTLPDPLDAFRRTTWLKL